MWALGWEALRRGHRQSQGPGNPEGVQSLLGALCLALPLPGIGLPLLSRLLLIPQGPGQVSPLFQSCPDSHWKNSVSLDWIMGTGWPVSQGRQGFCHVHVRAAGTKHPLGVSQGVLQKYSLKWPDSVKPSSVCQKHPFQGSESMGHGQDQPPALLWGAGVSSRSSLHGTHDDPSGQTPPNSQLKAVLPGGLVP